MGTLLRYPHEVRDPQEYFDEIQDVKVTKDMPDLARHIVEQKSGSFEPDKFEDQYEAALVDLINQKRAGKPITRLLGICRDFGAACGSGRWRGPILTNAASWPRRLPACSRMPSSRLRWCRASTIAFSTAW